MTAPELTAAEAARVAAIEAAPAAEEALIERIVDALYGVRWPDGDPLLHMSRVHARKLAAAALAVVRGEVQ